MTSVLIDPVSDRVWESEMPWKWSVRGGFQAALDAVAAVHGTEFRVLVQAECRRFYSFRDLVGFMHR